MKNKKLIVIMAVILCMLFTLAACSSSSKTEKALVGEWRNVIDTVTKISFYEDSTGLYSGESEFYGFNWSVDKDVLTISADNKTETFTVSTEEDVMKIVSSDEKAIFVTSADYEAERNKIVEEIKSRAISLEIDKTYEDAAYADFKIVKIATVDKVEASMGSSLHYTPPEGKLYLDVVADYTNRSENSIKCDDLLTLSATKNDGTEITDASFFVEEDNGTSISAYADVAPLSTVRLHCALAIDKSDENYTISLTVNGQMYTYNYAYNQIISNSKTIKLGETLEEENVAKVVFKSVDFTEDLLPSNTAGSYRHYPVDNASNVYLVARFDVTNYQSADKKCDTFVYVKSRFMDKYSYNGFTIVEDTDEKGFSSYDSISPLTTRKVYCLIEVPKTVMDSNYELTITFAGQEYSYKAN